jgi:hypothetical protein
VIVESRHDVLLLNRQWRDSRVVVRSSATGVPTEGVAEELNFSFSNSGLPGQQESADNPTRRASNLDAQFVASARFLCKMIGRSNGPLSRVIARISYV